MPRDPLMTSASPSAPAVPEDNFSLSQALAVFVVAGALASLASGTVVQPLKQRLSEAARIDLTGLADRAVRRLGDDLRQAAPQHTRVAGDGMTLELAAPGPRGAGVPARLPAAWRPADASGAGRAAPPQVTYVCDLARGRLVRLEGGATDAGGPARWTVLAERVVACRFSQAATALATVSRVGLTLTLSQPTPAGPATVRREHWLPVGPGA